MKSLYKKSYLVSHSVVQFMCDFEYSLTLYDFTSSHGAFSHDPIFRKFSISDLADDFQASFSLPCSASCINAGVFVHC